MRPKEDACNPVEASRSRGMLAIECTYGTIIGSLLRCHQQQYLWNLSIHFQD